jgi:pimeloyl-ACP methyl ester carboxylesterase
MARRALRIAAVLIAATAVLSACSSTSSADPLRPSISRRPAAADYSFMKDEPVSFTKPTDPTDAFPLDLRQHDLSKEDLSRVGDVLMGYATFDSRTIWPTTLPKGYDPTEIMELGKAPGLGMAKLHEQGITGKGVRVAFLDQALLVDHEEYKDRIQVYREVGKVDRQAAMHGGAVTSILAGKTVGVAPDVVITYYAVDNRNGSWANHARVINQILDANGQLPPAQQIHVIGVSWGFTSETAGYKEIKAAVARAKKEGVFVLTTAVDEDYTFKFHGLGRDPLADPNRVDSYRPGSWWADEFYADPSAFTDRILVPMDSRTTAAPTGTSEYVFCRLGGASWVVPYLAGMYALGLQVKQDLTPEQFYRAALETGSYTQFIHEGKTYKLGPIINPTALIERLQKQ